MNRQLGVQAWELTRGRTFEDLLSRQAWSVGLRLSCVPAVDPRKNMWSQRSLPGGAS
jgi:hypothetical protein